MSSNTQSKSSLQDWKAYQISTVDLGKTIQYMDSGIAIINEENAEQLKSQITQALKRTWDMAKEYPPIEPIGADLVESNNQHERQLEALSKRVANLQEELNSIKKEQVRKRSMEF